MGIEDASSPEQSSHRVTESVKVFSFVEIRNELVNLESLLSWPDPPPFLVPKSLTRLFILATKITAEIYRPPLDAHQL